MSVVVWDRPRLSSPGQAPVTASLGQTASLVCQVTTEIVLTVSNKHKLTYFSNSASRG